MQWCTQKYKKTANVLPPVGQVCQQTDEDGESSSDSGSSEEGPIQEEQVQFTSPVKMVVVDGIVMGTLVSFNFDI